MVELVHLSDDVAEPEGCSHESPVANPDSPVKAAEIEKADIILVADGHPDQLFGGAKRPFMSGTWAHRRLTWTSLHRSL